MEVIDKRQTKGEKLMALRNGDIFDYGGEIFMKIDINRNEEEQNVFSLTKNTGAYISSDTRVRKVRATLNILDETGVKLDKQDQTKPETDPKKKAHKGGRPRLLDTGKVMALHNAGWSAKEIADEMNCTQVTVTNYLKEAERGKEDEEQ